LDCFAALAMTTDDSVRSDQALGAALAELAAIERFFDCRRQLSAPAIRGKLKFAGSLRSARTFERVKQLEFEQPPCPSTSLRTRCDADKSLVVKWKADLILSEV